MEQTAEEVSPIHVGGHRGSSGRQLVRSRRWDQPEPSVWSLVVVMADVDLEHPFEVGPVQDEEPVETLRPRRPNPALRVGVGSGGPHRRAEHPDGHAPEDLIKRPGELAVPIPHHYRASAPEHGSGWAWPVGSTSAARQRARFRICGIPLAEKGLTLSGEPHVALGRPASPERDSWPAG